MVDFAIGLYYIHESAGIWSLHDLANNRGVIGCENLGALGFGNSRGMLRVFRDRIYCLLEHQASVDLFEYVHFLWGTLAVSSLAATPSQLREFIPTESFRGLPNICGVLYGEDLSTVVVQSTEHVIRLSYLDSEGHVPAYRLSPYFSGVEVPRSTWRAAAFEALEEYFTVARRQLQAEWDSILGTRVSLWDQTNAQLRE